MEDPSLPLNMLAGTPLDAADDLVIFTSREVIELGIDRVRPITGLPDHGDGTVASVREVAGEVVVSVDCPMCDDLVGPEVFVVRDASAGPTIADGWATPGVAGIWLTRRDGASCEIRAVALDGSVLRPNRAVDCDLTVIEETSLGIVAARGATGVLVDPDTLDETVLPGRVIAVFDDRVLVEHGGAMAVVDPATGASTAVTTPESDGRLGAGLVSPDGRFVLMTFGNPAWPGPRQLLDLWLLDTATLQWSQLPGMPVAVALKSLGVDWSPDGRVVMLGSFDGVGTTVATWTPTEDQLRLRTIDAQASSSIVVTTAAG